MIKIIYEPENARTAAYYDDKEVGECTYREENNTWFAEHTFVNSDYSGKGIAKQLVEKLVEQARINNKKIVPICSYVVREFEKTPEYADVRF
jgi:acetyltransferase, GNAT family